MMMVRVSYSAMMILSIWLGTAWGHDFTNSPRNEVTYYLTSVSGSFRDCRMVSMNNVLTMNALKSSLMMNTMLLRMSKHLI